MDPLDGASDRAWKPPEVVHAVDRRRVPIPSKLARSSGPDGGLFRTYKDGVYQPSTLWRVLDVARGTAHTAAQAKTGR